MILSPFLLFSNNIEVKNVTIQSQNEADDYYMVSMDLSWSNSWRTSTYESNWDAAWVFIKYTIKNQQAWSHGVLNYVDGTNDGHIAHGWSSNKWNTKCEDHSKWQTFSRW